MSPANEMRLSDARMSEEAFEAAPSVPVTPRKTPRAFMQAVGGFFSRKSATSRSSMSSERSWRRTRGNSTSQSRTHESVIASLHTDHGSGGARKTLREASSPTDPGEMDTVEATPEFLFYGGSDRDGSFKPDLQASDLDRIDHKSIRPALRQHMPVFFSPPQIENLRRSSLCVDPTEYEF